MAFYISCCCCQSFFWGCLTISDYWMPRRPFLSSFQFWLTNICSW